MYSQEADARSPAKHLLAVGKATAGAKTAPTKLAPVSRPASIERAQGAIIPMDTTAPRTADALAPAQGDVAQGTARAIFLDEFAASIAHELNESLATIVTKGETCLRWLGGEKPQIDLASAGIATMIENALCLGDIVWRASALSTRADAKTTELDPHKGPHAT